MMAWLSLAAQLALALPAGSPFPDVRGLFSPDDMPAYVQIAEINRFVPTRTTFRPDGVVQSCTFEGSSGDAKLDALTCAIILRRAKGEPVKWIDGSPAYAVVRVPVSWTIGGPPSESEIRKAYPADMELAVSQLPAKFHRTASLALVIAVEASGRVVGCNERPRSSQRDHAKSFSELVPVACEHMINEFKAVPAKDAYGQPVRSLQTASVVFTTAGSAF
jgi:hypothetical protein